MELGLGHVPVTCRNEMREEPDSECVSFASGGVLSTEIKNSGCCINVRPGTKCS